MQIKFFIFATLISFFSQGQHLKRIAKLSNELEEISGLVTYNDTLFLAHNDGGNKPVLYFLDKLGTIKHRVTVQNATNVDWEDLTKDDKGNLYLADLGNNLNKRTDLCIYVIQLEGLHLKNSISAEKINIRYKEQKAFPPREDSLHFDVEAITFYNDSLYLFSKSKTKPFDGICNVYKLPTIIGTYALKKTQTLQFKTRKEILDAVTAATVIDKRFYILTYSGIDCFEIQENGLLNHKDRTNLEFLSQKEALCSDGKFFYLADEKRGKLGGKLYALKLKLRD